jgi:diguanylate cyclase
VETRIVERRGRSVRTLSARLSATVREPGHWLLWTTLTLLVLLFAAHQDLGFGGAGSNGLFNGWLNDGIEWAVAVVCLVGALRQKSGRRAWILVTIGLTSWAIGDTIWSIRFGPSQAGPLTSISDVFWLAWYPLILTALALLVRDRVPTFELHRWIDGVAVMLLVMIPWVALFLAPVYHHSHETALAQVVDFAYPLGDAIVFGSTLGVFAMTGWRPPGRMWVLLGIGAAAMGVADSIYAVQALEGTKHISNTYGALWLAGVVLVACACWQPHPGRLKPREVYGWPAIVLPLIAQGIAVAIQIYGFFHEIPRSERIFTLIVLVIATIQIAVTRPRRPGASGPDPPG